MNLFHTTALLVSLAAAASYINYRYIKLPATIGLMAIALCGSMGLVIVGELGVVPLRIFAKFISSINFNDVLLHGMLAFLLFAGALHVELDDLREARLPVAILSTVSVVIATLLTGGLFWICLKFTGYQISWLYALLFGALISPTDPIAVLGIIKKVGAPKLLETKIAGESLFNDGIGVVVFLTILGVVTGESTPEPVAITKLLLKEAIGGVGLGLVLGWITYRLLRSVDAYQVEILLTLALVCGGYALAELIHVSAPIFIVVAGLLIGNPGRTLAMSDTTREHLDTFWELIDEILNAVLFMLIGFELIVIVLHPGYILAGLGGILVALVGRFISVGIPIWLLRFRRSFMRGTVRVLTWGGLRGGISIALALSLPAGTERDLIVAVTYVVVIFSVLVQGLTFGYVLKFFDRPQPVHSDQDTELETSG